MSFGVLIPASIAGRTRRSGKAIMASVLQVFGVHAEAAVDLDARVAVEHRGDALVEGLPALCAAGLVAAHGGEVIVEIPEAALALPLALVEDGIGVHAGEGAVDHARCRE